MNRNARIPVIARIMIFGVMLYVSSATAQSSYNCGSLENAYGPYDYINSRDFSEKLPIVERAHFDAGVESLEGHMGKPQGKSMLAGDLDYTLRAFPNHHRALVAMMQYYLTKVSYGAKPMRYTAECYFDRAIRNSPEDPTVRMIQGLYFYKAGRMKDALASYSAALELAPDSAEVHYNAGLIYLELGDEESALRHAKFAYDKGYPLPGLRNKLIRSGSWEKAQVSAEDEVSN